MSVLLGKLFHGCITEQPDGRHQRRRSASAAPPTDRQIAVLASRQEALARALPRRSRARSGAAAATSIRAARRHHRIDAGILILIHMPA